MPTLKRFKAYRIEMRYRDHLPPHVHIVANDGRQALVEIEALKAIGNLPARERKDGMAWIRANASFLLEQWRQMHG